MCTILMLVLRLWRTQPLGLNISPINGFFYTEGKWQYMDFKLRCRPVLNTTCTEANCSVNSTCYDRPDGVGFCICKHGYEGANCFERSITCSSERELDNGFSFAEQGPTDGQNDIDQLAYFCKKGYNPAFVNAICVIGENGTASWNIDGGCELITTSTPTPTTTSTPTPTTTSTPTPTTTTLSPTTRSTRSSRLTSTIRWSSTTSWSYWEHRTTNSWYNDKRYNDIDEDHPWLFAFLISITCIWELGVPVILWITLICIQSYNEVQEDHNEQELNEKWNSHVDEAFDEFIASHPEIDFEAVVDAPPPTYSEATGTAVASSSSRGQNEEEDIPEPEPKFIFLSNPDYQRFKADLAASRDEFNEKNKVEITGCTRHVKNVSFLRISSFNSFLCLWVLVFYSILWATVPAMNGSSQLITFLVFAVIFIVIDYIFIFVESFFSSEVKYLRTVKDSEAAMDFIRKMRASQATITLQVENYHFELRTRTMYYTDANGNQQSYLQTYQERVVSSSDYESFRYKHWKDESANSVSNINTKGITKIKVAKNVVFGDSETVLAFSRACEAMKSRNENKDLYMDFQTDYFIPGYKKRLATFMNKSTIPFWMNQPWYYVCSVFGLTWVFRIAFRLNTGSANYKVVKRIYLNAPSTGEQVNNYANSDEDRAKQNLREPDTGIEEKAGNSRAGDSATVPIRSDDEASVAIRSGTRAVQKPRSRISLQLHKSFRRSGEGPSSRADRTRSGPDRLSKQGAVLKDLEHYDNM